jgi:hypothetical protein
VKRFIAISASELFNNHASFSHSPKRQLFFEIDANIAEYLTTKTQSTQRKTGKNRNPAGCDRRFAANLGRTRRKSPGFPLANEC